MHKKPLWISKFQDPDVSFCASFRCSVAGIVQHVQPMTTSLAKGDDKFDFTLIDDDGAWISCCAMGINAQADIIVEGHRVVCFFGTGRGGIGSDDIKIIFFETDTTLVKVKAVRVIPCKQTHIHIQENR